MITKTKRVQQSFDTIHDFYDINRGLFKTGVKTNEAEVTNLQTKLASLAAGDQRITKIQNMLIEAQKHNGRIPLYRTMRAVMQYMIITLNSIMFNINITPTPDIHTLMLNYNTKFTNYVGSNKLGQLFFTGDGKTPTSPKSGVSISDIEITGRDYFEIPAGRTWTVLADAKTSFINLASMLFNLDNNPDQATIDAYTQQLEEHYAKLGQPVPPTLLTPGGRKFTNAHRIYMVCDAGANTYGKLAESVRASADGPPLTQLVNQCETADSASSNPYQDHKFVFVPSDPANPDADIFVSDANLYTSDIYEIRYERHNWSEHTGLGFRLVISRKETAVSPKTDLFSVVYGVLGTGQGAFVIPSGSKAQPAVYNSQGPSAAVMIGCALLRALNSIPITEPDGTVIPGVVLRGFKDIQDEKLKGAHGPVRNRVTDPLRIPIINELVRIMTQENGFSLLSATADMVDPYNLLGNQFGTLPPELWLDIKRGGDRDQVKVLHILSQQRDVSGNLLYPFIHFVTGDLLAAKMAVELGLATIYQANGEIRYWPKMFRFRPESRDLPSPHGITTTPAPDAANGQWAIAQWGGKQMKGGLRNPISKVIGTPPYTHIEDYEGRQYTQHDLVAKNIPRIIREDLWLNPSEYVLINSHQQISPLDLPLFHYNILDSFITLLQFMPQILQEHPQLQELLQHQANIKEILSNIQKKQELEQQIEKLTGHRRIHLQQGMHELTVLKRNRYTEATRMALAQYPLQPLQTELTATEKILENQLVALNPLLNIIPSLEPILLAISSNDPIISDVIQQLQLAHANNSGIYQ
jgi:hypothetical protein